LTRPSVAAAGSDSDAVVVMGRVLGPYGVKGWVRIQPFSGESDALLGYARWWLRSKGSPAWRQMTRDDARMHSGAVLAQFADVASREEAMALRGAEVGIARSDLPALAPGELYWSDLAGLAVVNREGVLLGTVAAVTEFGAHPLLRVAPAAGQGQGEAQGGQGERLIPFVAAIVDRVDVAAKRIDVDWQPDY